MKKYLVENVAFFSRINLKSTFIKRDNTGIHTNILTKSFR